MRFRPGRTVILPPPATPSGAGPAAPEYFGAGDLVAVVAEPVKRGLVLVPGLREWLEGCGCAERRARWNQRWPLWKRGKPGVGVSGDP